MAPADRRPLGLIEKALQQWCVQGYFVEAYERERQGGWRAPWLDEAKMIGRESEWWTPVLRFSSAGGGRTGSRVQASDVGAVMMLRDGKLGLPPELEGRQR